MHCIGVIHIIFLRRPFHVRANIVTISVTIRQFSLIEMTWNTSKLIVAKGGIAIKLKIIKHIHLAQIEFLSQLDI